MKRKCVSYHVKCATVDTEFSSPRNSSGLFGTRLVPSDDSFFVGRSVQEVCPEVTPEETTFVAQLQFVTLEMAGAGGKNPAKAL